MGVAENNLSSQALGDQQMNDEGDEEGSDDDAEGGGGAKVPNKCGMPNSKEASSERGQQELACSSASIESGNGVKKECREAAHGSNILLHEGAQVGGGRAEREGKQEEHRVWQGT